MTRPRGSPSRGVPGEARIVAALCVLAALRVFLFSAGFPFFNNVDEQAHFDLVHKYARGHAPAGLEKLDVEAVRDMTLYGSPEYLTPAWRFAGGVPPPPVWRMPFDDIRAGFEAYVSQVSSGPNFESTQPPLYYAVAGLWYRLGRLAGLRGGLALYWIRFLDVLVVALLVGLAWLFARTLFPADPFLRLGAPLLVAFLPQDALFSINNDVLVPLAGGAALLGLFVVAAGEERPGAWAHAVTGLLVAAAVLVKISCLPLLAVAAVAVVLAVRRTAAARRGAAIGHGALLLLAALLPVVAWGARNLRLVGDWSGSAPKVAHLGWTLKSPGAVFDHPLFTPGGLAAFWSETLASFWRGEFTWGLERIASGGWDLFFQLTSLALPLAVLVALLVRRPAIPRGERAALALSLTAFLMSLAFLAALSLIYDFGACFYPSREHPFLTSGRLALAALLPFVVLYLKGLELLLPWRGAARLRWLLLLALVVLMTAAEVRMSWSALHSAHNWFHLL